MSLYLVRDPDTGEPAWLAWVDTAQARVYSWIPNLSRFVVNAGLWEDFYRDQEMTYEAIDDNAAHAAIAAQVGRIGVPDRQWMVDRFAQHPLFLAAADVLASP